MAGDGVLKKRRLRGRAISAQGTLVANKDVRRVREFVVLREHLRVARPAIFSFTMANIARISLIYC